MNMEVLTGLTSIGLAALIIGVGTYAFFSDTETSTGNTLTAGLLNLKVNGVDGPFTKFVDVKDLKPSYTRFSDTITLTVVDNPGRLYKRISNVVCTPQPGVLDPRDEYCTAQCGTDETCFRNCINQQMYDKIWFDLNVKGMQTIPDQAVTMKQLENKWIYLGCYQPNTDVPVLQSFHMKNNVENWAQGQTCTFTEDFMVEETIEAAPPNCFGNCQFCFVGTSPFDAGHQQGLQRNGAPVSPARSIPSQALYYESGQNEHNFFSLGFTGWFIVGFNYPIVNGPGPDVKVIEDTWGAYPVETAEIYASQDAITWVDLGQADNVHREPPDMIHTVDSFDLGSLQWAKYIKVVDTTPLANFPLGSYPGADGYDLNAVVALGCVEPKC